MIFMNPYVTFHFNALSLEHTNFEDLVQINQNVMNGREVVDSPLIITRENLVHKSLMQYENT